MKLTAQILLNPTKEQAQLLVETLQAANKACNFISDYAWDKQVFKKFDLQTAVYYQIKEKFNLSAQMVVRCLSKVADAYKLDKKSKRTFRPLGSIAYDNRILSYKTIKQTVSLWTLEGRQTIPYLVGEHHKRLLQYQQGESDLVFKKGRFYLLATCEVPEEESEPFVNVLGVDLGIVSIATTSEGQTYTGEQIEAVRQWYFNRKQVLQSVGTRSAKRRLKKLSGKESKFRTHTNHKISKELVQYAAYTNSAIALEDLTGIRKGTKVRKAQRAKHNSWSFHQLRSFVTYKAKKKGITVLLVDPRNTSRTCNECGHCDKANRKSQSNFLCLSCGHSANADFNASKNMKALGLLSIQPMVSTCNVRKGQALAL
jgi:putative transposase